MLCPYFASLNNVVSLGGKGSKAITEGCLKEKTPDTLSELNNLRQFKEKPEGRRRSGGGSKGNNSINIDALKTRLSATYISGLSSAVSGEVFR